MFKNAHDNRTLLSLFEVTSLKKLHSVNNKGKRTVKLVGFLKAIITSWSHTTNNTLLKSANNLWLSHKLYVGQNCPFRYFIIGKKGPV